MRKLTVLVAVILVAVLLAGCWVSPEPKLDYIEVEPNEVTLYLTQAAKNTQQLEVIFFKDGTARVVTRACDYLSSLSNTASVTNEGLITGEEAGFAVILVTYFNHDCWAGGIIKTAEVKVIVKY